jgi:hypothetical protein
MELSVLGAAEYGARVADYMAAVDPSWEEDAWRGQQASERERLPLWSARAVVALHWTWAVAPVANRSLWHCWAGG